MLIYRMLVERTSYNYSEEAINRQYLKLVSYVPWLTKKHMYSTCCRLHLQAVCFLAQMAGGKWGAILVSEYPIITDSSCIYETGISQKIVN